MSGGTVRLKLKAGVASVFFDRPEARNAMTWTMYGELAAICKRLQTEPDVRVATFRGVGGVAFVAGTDIEQFKGFGSGEAGGNDGLAYERNIDEGISLIESLPMPTVAVVEGWAVGGGLAIASACDFRVATPGSRFGVPIAKTLGNCLSAANLARLCAVWGAPRVKRMLLLADIIAADEALAAGYLLQLSPTEDIDGVVAALCERLTALAPVTQRATKEGMRRLVTHHLPADDDLIRMCYGSEDFRAGVHAFADKTSAVWKGR
ncbi:MAG: Enoyl-CoA hydratase/isomerase [Polaromonas sp.]|nr:Enoyl-CoA hydratase/isomerase [Polaromonas sp.]